MKKLKFTSEFKEYSSHEELKKKDRQLLKKARKTMMSAYAPYSRFRVGAAVLLANGKTITGNNQENASYPVGLCAERVALFAAGANHPEVRIKAIAVAVYSEDATIDEPSAPCGACRQAIAEYEHRYGKPIRLIMAGETGKVLIADGIENLLPLQFNGDSLGK